MFRSVLGFSRWIRSLWVVGCTSFVYSPFWWLMKIYLMNIIHCSLVGFSFLLMYFMWIFQLLLLMVGSNETRSTKEPWKQQAILATKRRVPRKRLIMSIWVVIQATHSKQLGNECQSENSNVKQLESSHVSRFILLCNEFLICVSYYMILSHGVLCIRN